VAKFSSILFLEGRPVKKLLAAAIAVSLLVPAVQAADEEGFVSMFNGKDLTGWRGDKETWSVQDGAITGKTTTEKPLRNNTFLIWEGGQPGDFELRAKYKMVGNNSGIQYRSKVIDEAKFIVGGYQADIDAKHVYTGMLYEERGRGILAQRGTKLTIGAEGAKESVTIGDKEELKSKIKNEDWNDYTIIAKGNHLQHFINGTLMSEMIDNQKDKAATSGVIALQAHQGPAMTIQFKDLRIKTLK
jgi:hypothetical protein